ncbi:hypothetical protein [Streptomyces sp. NPDC048516]|uniref:hypothetical protein n=1 Tax=Streptomyces sp. NPDC048516 TaxID=3365565 RepID=UPI00371E590B
MTSRPAQQPSLPDIPEQGRRRIWCRRELHDPDSRTRGWGRECDPANTTQHRDHGVDQDTIPGT